MDLKLAEGPILRRLQLFRYEFHQTGDIRPRESFEQRSTLRRAERNFVGDQISQSLRRKAAEIVIRQRLPAEYITSNQRRIKLRWEIRPLIARFLHVIELQVERVSQEFQRALRVRIVGE